MLRFEGRRVLITAGASGLGLGMALRLAEESAAVTVWDRDAKALAEIEKAGHDLRNVCLDMTSAQDIEAAVAEMGKAGQAGRCTRLFAFLSRAKRIGNG